MEKQELLGTIERSHQTRELGIWNSKTKKRYSQVGRVGEALVAAAEAAKADGPEEPDFWEILAELDSEQ